MKTILNILFLLGFAPLLHAQNTFPSSGNVGIGTTSPGAKLSFNDVNDGSNGADGITWLNSAPMNYGIYRTPGLWVIPNYQQLKLSWFTGITLDPGSSYGKSYVEILRGGLRVTSGNVGIGIANPTEKLAVNGKVRAKEIKVELTNWADFVFAKDYKLSTLQEIEQHIKAHGHLPGIPSAAEVEKNGVELGEMNKKLLQKIEELTLYLIEKDKKEKAQQQEIEAMKNQIKGILAQQK